MNISKTSMAVIALAAGLLLNGASADTGEAILPPQPGELVAYTLNDALVNCQTLPAEHVAECAAAAHATDWP